MYRRIADIRNKADSEDVIDEIRDRFGEIPKSVYGLVDIALIRNKANSMGVFEIRQNENTLLLYVREIKSPVVADLLIALNGKAMLNGGTKPFLSVKCEDSGSPLETLKNIFAV